MSAPVTPPGSPPPYPGTPPPYPGTPAVPAEGKAAIRPTVSTVNDEKTQLINSAMKERLIRTPRDHAGRSLRIGLHKLTPFVGHHRLAPPEGRQEAVATDVDSVARETGLTKTVTALQTKRMSREVSKKIVDWIQTQQATLFEETSSELQRHKITLEGHKITVLVSKDGNIFIERKEIGTGRWKTARLGINFFTGEQVALLTTIIPYRGRQIRITSKNEEAFLRRFQGKEGIVQTHQIYYTSPDENEQQVIVQRFYNGGSVADYNKNHPDKPLTRAQRVKVALDFLKGLQAIHGEGVIHGDLKPQNSQWCQLKLTFLLSQRYLNILS